MTLSGSLSEFKIINVLKMIQETEISGFLKISDINQRELGKIFFKKGKVEGAEFKNLKGLEAFYSLLFFNKGSFEFIPSEVIEQEGIISKTVSDLSKDIEKVLTYYKKTKDMISSLSDIVSIKANIDSQGEITFSQDEWKFLRLAGLKKSIQDIALESNLGLFKALEVLESLNNKGVIKIEEILEIPPIGSELVIEKVDFELGYNIQEDPEKKIQNIRIDKRIFDGWVAKDKTLEKADFVLVETPSKEILKLVLNLDTGLGDRIRIHSKKCETHKLKNGDKVKVYPILK